MAGFLLQPSGRLPGLRPRNSLPHIYYGRQVHPANGTMQEESDRYAQALVYARVARECFERAKTESYGIKGLLSEMGSGTVILLLSNGASTEVVANKNE